MMIEMGVLKVCVYWHQQKVRVRIYGGSCETSRSKLIAGKRRSDKHVLAVSVVGGYRSQMRDSLSPPVQRGWLHRTTGVRPVVKVRGGSGAQPPAPI